MYNIFVGILQAIGDSRHPLYYLMISSVINLILDLLFIEVFHTGVGGAAVATVISQVFSAILCCIQLLRTNDIYRLQIPEIRFHGKVLKQIIRVGLPSGIQNSIIAFANVVVQSYINTFGEMAMAGYGAYSKIEGFAFSAHQQLHDGHDDVCGPKSRGGPNETDAAAVRGSEF